MKNQRGVICLKNPPSVLGYAAVAGDMDGEKLLKMSPVAGPVIVYKALASMASGLISYIIKCCGGNI